MADKGDTQYLGGVRGAGAAGGSHGLAVCRAAVALDGKAGRRLHSLVAYLDPTKPTRFASRPTCHLPHTHNSKFSFLAPRL